MARKVSPARASWKVLWRLIRIARRETAKAYVDMAVYGSCYIEMTDDGPRHIPLQDISK